MKIVYNKKPSIIHLDSTSEEILSCEDLLVM